MCSEFDNLIGKTFKSVTQNEGGIVLSNNKEEYRLVHEQECCERVDLIDVCGDLNDLLNTPIVSVLVEGDDANKLIDQYVEEWELDDTEMIEATFLTIRTIKGTVTLRYMGTSNGCYSMTPNLTIRDIGD